MAFFSGDPIKGGDKERGFTFDIDEQGHSMASRQRATQQTERDISLINHGKHCAFPLCGQLDVLPSTCEYCEKVFCKSHAFPQQHDCFFDLTTLNLAVRCKRCDKHIKMQNIQSLAQQREVISTHLSSGCTAYVLERSEQEKNSIRQSLMCSAPGCTNHLATGKRLSTMRCKMCHQQVCLSHRFSSNHKCRPTRNTTTHDEGDGVTDKQHKTLWQKSQEYLRSILSRSDDVQEVETIIVSPSTIVAKTPPPSPSTTPSVSTASPTPSSIHDIPPISGLPPSSSSSSPSPTATATTPTNTKKTDTNTTTSSHFDSHSQPTAQSRSQPTPPQPQHQLITVASSNPINTQRSLALAKQKSRTYGTKSAIPEEDRVPIIIYFPEASAIPPACGKLPKQCASPVYAYVNQKWSIGRCIDDITKTLNIKNNNHIPHLPQIRLSLLQNTLECCPNSTLVKDIIKTLTDDYQSSQAPTQKRASPFTPIPLHVAFVWSCPITPSPSSSTPSSPNMNGVTTASA